MIIIRSKKKLCNFAQFFFVYWTYSDKTVTHIVTKIDSFFLERISEIK